MRRATVTRSKQIFKIKFRCSFPFSKLNHRLIYLYIDLGLKLDAPTVRIVFCVNKA